MTDLRPIVGVMALWVCLGAKAPSVRAQSPDAGTWEHAAPSFARDAEAPVPPEGVALPLLLEASPVRAPASQLEADADVVLSLTIDATGAVTAAEVVSGLTPELDAEAQRAALGFRFRPALLQGVPVPARVQHPVTVLATPAPPTPRDPTPKARPVPVPEGITEVTVRGVSEAQRKRASAEAVVVVETEEARRESADLGEVLARSQGVSIRRGGGLGSSTRLSLNGLGEQQVRLFIDGVPLDVMGFGFNLANVPVNLIERVEVYRGVVPIRFGADALGGAVNLVSVHAPPRDGASASVALGSFGTYRLTLAGQKVHRPSGLFAAFNGFFDHADNDYPVDVEVADAQGRLSPARAYRFHDAYAAYGGGLEVGFRERSWARRLSLRLFGARQDKEIQNNVVMLVPYGEVHLWEATRGATLRYEQPRLQGTNFGVDAVLAVSRRTTQFEDLSDFVYDWFGRRVRARRRPGEIADARDERLWQHTALSRIQLSWVPSSSHALRLSLAPTLVERTGRDDLVSMGRDPLSAERRSLSMVNGLEYQWAAFARRLETVVFAKSYLFAVRSEEALPGGVFARRDQARHDLGMGLSLRFRVARPLWFKASYERATRLPSPDELFGNGSLIGENLALRPERSHNANLSATLDWRRTPLGDFRAEVNAFLRRAENLIVLLGTDVFSYQNVDVVRSQGVENGAGWSSPRGHWSLDGNLTWLDLRNDAAAGPFARYDGDRMPNQPWLMANATTRARLPRVSSGDDELSLAYHLRYVHGFSRFWESEGTLESRQQIPSQTTHGLVLAYGVRGALTQTWSAEVQNLTDAKVFDHFGVQRPGRAFFAKVTASY